MKIDRRWLALSAVYSKERFIFNYHYLRPPPVSKTSSCALFSIDRPRTRDEGVRLVLGSQMMQVLREVPEDVLNGVLGEVHPRLYVGKDLRKYQRK